MQDFISCYFVYMHLINKRFPMLDLITRYKKVRTANIVYMYGDKQRLSVMPVLHTVHMYMSKNPFFVSALL